MQDKCYFDHNATTRLNAQALKAMIPFMDNLCANPSSIHGYGRLARAAVENAKSQLADSINAEPNEITFTSGGTESNNWILRSLNWQEDDVLVLSCIEHDAIIQPSVWLAKHAGVVVKSIPLDENLQLDFEYALSLCTPKVRLISIMMANNESGTLCELKDWVQKVKARYPNILIHTDAVQALGKETVDFKDLGVDFMSLSAHKIGGPKGIGALVIKEGCHLEPFILGGGQQDGLRSGTENVPGVVGFGAAAIDVSHRLSHRRAHFLSLRQALEEGLQAYQSQGKVMIIGEHIPRLLNTCLFAVKDKDAQDLLLKLDKAGFCVSSGSACASSKGEPSHVLRAFGLDESYQGGVIRVSFGDENTIEQVNAFIKALDLLI